METINKEQIDKLWKKINEYKIPLETIKGLLNVNYIQDITIRQYNHLLMTLYLVEEVNHGKD